MRGVAVKADEYVKVVMTKEQFERLEPRPRGYAVYLLGAREDQPNVPDESNPYPKGSTEWEAWNAGAQAAYLEVLDGEE